MKKCSLKIFLLPGFVLLFFGKLMAQTDSIGLPTGIYQEKEGSKRTLIDELAKDTLHVDPVAICTARDFSGVYLKMNKYAPAGTGVWVRFNKSGKEKFRQATMKNLDKKLVFVCDGKLISAPVINSVLNLDDISFASQLPFPEAKLLKLKLEEEIPESGKIKVIGAKGDNSRLALLAACSSMDSALVAKDTDKLANLFSNALTFKFYFGWELEKDFFPYAFQLGYISYSKIEQEGRAQIKTDNSVASVDRTLKVSGKYMGEDFEERIHVLEVWLWENGSWQLFVRQGVKR
jgi:hypothetical protein